MENKKNKKVMFLGEECIVDKLEYANNENIALILRTTETGETMCIASTNTNMTLPKGEVAIKNYSENEGILEVLVNAGIVSSPTYYTNSGFVSIPICKFLGVKENE